MPAPSCIATLQRQKPVTRLLLRFAFLDSVAVVGTRVTAAINCGFLFCLFSISVLYWALLFWFPLCRNKPGAKGRGGKTKLNSWPHSCIQAHTPLSRVHSANHGTKIISQPPKCLMQHTVPQDNQLNTHATTGSPRQVKQKGTSTYTQSQNAATSQQQKHASTQTFSQRCMTIFNIQMIDAIQRMPSRFIHLWLAEGCKNQEKWAKKKNKK